MSSEPASKPIPALKEGINAALKLEQFLPYRINQMADRVSSALTELFSSRFGVSISEWRVLALLGQQESTTASDISQRTRMDKAKVSRAVQKLEQDGYLCRQRDEQDHRVSHLSLTPEGVALYNAIIPTALAWEQKMAEDLMESEYRLLHQLLNRLDRSLNAL